MNRLYSQDLLQFSRKYRFSGAKLRRFKLIVRNRSLAVELILVVQPAMKDLGGDTGKPVRLKLRLDGVDEYRFQKRPITTPAKSAEVKFGAFNGLIYINLDSWGLQPGDIPGVHDFRASDAFIACRDLSWEEVAAKG